MCQIAQCRAIALHPPQVRIARGAVRAGGYQLLLIADDDRDVVNLLALRCRAMGLDVLAAHDAFTALAIAKTQHPDFICLDVSMPGGNGLSACEMLISDDSFAAIPIMILTGHTDQKTIRRCHRMAAYYIEKCPDVWTRIEPLLDELLNAPHADARQPLFYETVT